MGTKAPHAATRGASIRLTLSPTPPLECLSITGPGSARLFHSSVVPEFVMPSGQRHPLGRRHAAEEHRHGEGRHLALAQAAVMDAAGDKAISSADNSWPSRFLRMISCGSIDENSAYRRQFFFLAPSPMATRISRSSARVSCRVRVVVPGEEAETQQGEGGDAGDVGRGGAGVGLADLGLDLAFGAGSCDIRAGSPRSSPGRSVSDLPGSSAAQATGPGSRSVAKSDRRTTERIIGRPPGKCATAAARRPRRARDGERLFVAEGAGHQAGSVVGHQRQRHDLEPGMARQDGLGCGRHADGVGAQHARGADLGRGLEARPAEEDVDAVMAADIGRVRRRQQLFQQRRIVGIDHVDEAAVLARPDAEQGD